MIFSKQMDTYATDNFISSLYTKLFVRNLTLRAKIKKVVLRKDI